MSIVVKKQKKHVYRKGDLVRIKNPLFVTRVGYPWTKQYVEENLITDEHRTIIHEMLVKLGITNRERTDLLNEFWYDKAVRGVIRAISGELLEKHGWGGRERRIHTREIEAWKDVKALVMSKRTVKTGDYHPRSSSQDYWTGEVEYDPAFLENEQTHVLLKIDSDSMWNRFSLISEYSSEDYPEIEECNVEPVVEEEKNEFVPTEEIC